MLYMQGHLLLTFRKFKLWEKIALSARTVPVMCFSFKFSKNDCVKILDVINNSNAENLSRFQLSSNRINKILQHRDKYGKFNNLDKMLEINGMGMKVVNKLFKNIVEFDENKPIDGIKKSDKPKIRGQLILPALSDKILMNLTNAVGIHIGVNSVSWAKVQRHKYLVTDWDMFNFTSDGSKRSLVDNFELVLQISKQIPSADIYVLEAAPKFSPSAQQQPLPILAYMQYLQISSMLITMLNTSKIHNPDFIFSEKIELMKNQLDDIERKLSMKHTVYFLRSHLPARIFRTLIGTERVSAENVVNDILRKSFSSASGVNFNEMIHLKYESRLPIEKEILGQALLLLLTFMDICVYQNIKNLKA